MLRRVLGQGLVQQDQGLTQMGPVDGAADTQANRFGGGMGDGKGIAGDHTQIQVAQMGQEIQASPGRRQFQPQMKGMGLAVEKAGGQDFRRQAAAGFGLGADEVQHGIGGAVGNPQAGQGGG